jgi:hypothetical protein
MMRNLADPARQWYWLSEKVFLGWSFICTYVLVSCEKINSVRYVWNKEGLRKSSQLKEILRMFPYISVLEQGAENDQ